MEGLKRPSVLCKKLKFVFLESDKYGARIATRIKITKQVLTKNKIKHCSMKVTGKTQLEQVLSCMVTGSAVGVALAAMYGEDPTHIPWVKYFKQQLSRQSS
jgi:hypothetical protein